MIQMKHLNTIILGVLCVAVIVLYILHFSSAREIPANATLDSNESVGTPFIDGFPIAYVDVDSLLLNYQLAKEVNENLLKKQEKYRKDIANKQQQLQQDAMTFQKKYESGGFQTKESFEQEQMRLIKKKQEMQEMDRRLSQEFFAEQQKMNTRLRDSITSFFKQYKQEKHYKIIFSDTGNDNIFYAEDYLNITSEVLEQLNLRYKSEMK